jgi:hypothetical protein
MHRKPLMFCGFTAMMGIFGAFLRWLQNLQGFDPDTGLAITYSPLHYIMIAFILGFGVWLWLYLRGLKNYTMPLKYPESFACPTKLWQVGSVVFSAIMILGALAILLSVISAMKSDTGAAAVYANFWQKLSSLGLIFNLLLAIFAFVCALCLLSFSDGVNGKNPRNGGAASIAVVIFFCYRLIATYKTFASDPVVWHYAIQILAVSAVLLAFYFVSGFAYNKPRMLPTLYFCLLGAFMSIISVADSSLEIGFHLISAATAGMLLLIAYAQLRNMSETQQAPAQV